MAHPFRLRNIKLIRLRLTTRATAASGVNTPYSATDDPLRAAWRDRPLRPSEMRRTAQVEGHRIFERALLLRQIEGARRMPEILESCQAPRLRFVRVDRQALVIPPARMNHVTDAAAERALAPTIENVKGERGMDVDRRMQRRR